MMKINPMLGRKLMDADRKEFIFQMFLIIALLIVSGSILTIAYYQYKGCNARSPQENVQDVWRREALDGVP